MESEITFTQREAGMAAGYVARIMHDSTEKKKLFLYNFNKLNEKDISYSKWSDEWFKFFTAFNDNLYDNNAKTKKCLAALSLFLEAEKEKCMTAEFRNCMVATFTTFTLDNSKDFKSMLCKIAMLD